MIRQSHTPFDAGHAAPGGPCPQRPLPGQGSWPARLRRLQSQPHGLQVRPRSATRMPDRWYLDARWTRADTVVNVITDAVEVKTPDVAKVQVHHRCAHTGLFSKKKERATKVPAEGIGRFGSVRFPPGDRFANLVPRATDNQQRVYVTGVCRVREAVPHRRRRPHDQHHGAAPSGQPCPQR